MSTIFMALAVLAMLAGGVFAAFGLYHLFRHSRTYHAMIEDGAVAHMFLRAAAVTMASSALFYLVGKS